VPDPVLRPNPDIASRLQAIHPARAAAVAGVAVIILGAIAIASPFVAGISVTYVVAMMLLLGSIALASLALGGDHTVGQRILGVLAALVLFVGGLGMIFAPTYGLLSLTGAVGIYLFMAGFARIIGAFLMPAHSGRVGVGLSGVAGVILGVLLLRQWPVSGLWAIGTLVGVDLVLQGASLLGSAWRLRRFRRALTVEP
jgi:uncharacterized membrane protein HdeD (DUF308 family)